MKKLIKQTIRKSWILALGSLMSYPALAREHVTMILKPVSYNANSLTCELLVMNDGTEPLRLSAFSYGINLPEALLQKGILTFYSLPNTRSVQANNLSRYAVAVKEYQQVHQCRMTSTPVLDGQAINLPANEAVPVGRFRIENNQPWAPNMRAGIQLQTEQVIGLTTTQLVAYVGSSEHLTALTPGKGTVSVRIESDPILNPQVDEFQTPVTTAANDKEVRLYPNPATDQVNIDLEMQEPGTLTLTLRDLQGRTVKRIRSQVNEGYNKLQINVSDIPKGSYTISVDNGADYHWVNTFTRM